MRGALITIRRSLLTHLLPLVSHSPVQLLHFLYSLLQASLQYGLFAITTYLKTSQG